MSMPTVWLFRAGKSGSLADLFRRQGFAAMGRREDGTVEGLGRDTVIRQMRIAYPERFEGSVRNYGHQLYRFANEVEIGDWLLTPLERGRILQIGQVHGDYEYQSTAIALGRHHIRKVR